ncbi:hypothetical protein ACU4GD_10465 [Cupriavidus basilensis]
MRMRVEGHPACCGDVLRQNATPRIPRFPCKINARGGALRETRTVLALIDRLAEAAKKER